MKDGLTAPSRLPGDARAGMTNKMTPLARNRVKRVASKKRRVVMKEELRKYDG